MKKFISSKLGRLAVAGVVAAGAVVGISVAANAAGGTGCATLTYPLCARSVAKAQVVDGSLDGAEIKDGSLNESEFDAATKAKLNAAGSPDVNGTSILKAVYNDVTIDNVGGSWLTRRTPLGSFQLPAGTWVISTSVQFQRTEIDETDPQFQTRPQLAVRFGASDTSFGSNFGTVMGTIAPYAGADAFGSDSRRVTLTEPATITVAAFGYQDNRGSDDSGKIKVVNATVFVQQG